MLRRQRIATITGVGVRTYAVTAIHCIDSQCSCCYHHGKLLHIAVLRRTLIKGLGEAHVRQWKAKATSSPPQAA